MRVPSTNMLPRTTYRRLTPPRRSSGKPPMEVKIKVTANLDAAIPDPASLLQT
ncbi:hypothetical protein COLO4_19543 [Corchorus olitorius]|uniref:Uncharacterized protein n=1 Tax=Corchorus olitorius TaxID=93759 RepID=A0A1R3J4W4_9ROSI|nr:hypothetical protein COLO4_19543 [Corchorus olitorius]